MLVDKIWINEGSDPDTYAEFVGGFAVADKKGVCLKIVCSGHFAVYLNEKLVYFGASSDYPWHKLYHKKDISKYCDYNNDIRIVVWYPGCDSQTYINDEPGVCFVIEQEGHVLLESGEHILSRQNMNYKNGYCKVITGQLGYSFFYDNSVKNELPFTQSVKRKSWEKIQQNRFGDIFLGKRAKCICKEIENGYLIDLGEEVVGFLDLEFVSSKEQTICISYGEHLVDGKVPRIIDARDFSVEFRAAEGKNTYLNPFRRLAGRYLQVECKKEIDIQYIGLRPTDRRVQKQKRRFKDEKLQQIYDVSVNTLLKCMHEHYEDCPWREQAMYTMDSRNQMLCGYYAFRGTRFQRENLLFIAKGQRKDGILSLCFPAGMDFPIPFFSLVYLMQLSEYVKYTGDCAVLPKVQPVVKRILDVFTGYRDDTGLIPNLPYPCWNFYEWSEGSNNDHDIDRQPNAPYVKQYDLILNCMYVYACRLYESLYGEKPECEDMAPIIHQTFYNRDSGLYCLSSTNKAFSQLGNSFALLIGLGDEVLAKNMLTNKEVIPVTLSMHTFFYDALLMFGDKYKSFIVEDIKKKYGYMLEQGATTFWETEKGHEDFGGAGSLCHGWSAIPAYYLPVLAEGE